MAYSNATIVRGANEAIVAGATSVDQVYRYQNASMLGLPPAAGNKVFMSPGNYYGNLFGGFDARKMPSYGANKQPNS